MHKRIPLPIGLALMLLLPGCDDSARETGQTGPPYSIREVVGAAPPKSDRIDIDVYVDATTSMEGFTAGEGSAYGQFLDQLEASALSAWKSANPRFYKFGQVIKPIDRSHFLLAKTSPGFYREKGVFANTYIDSVVNRTDPNNLSVLVTDLFQDEGDVNMMVESIKTKCFAKGVMVGVLGVKSAFKGTVYDVPAYPQGYPLDSPERPFYAVIFGNPYNMELLFEALKTRPFVRENQFLLFSGQVIRGFDVKLTKATGSRVTRLGGETGASPYVFDFRMFEGNDDVQFDLALTLDRNPHCADFSERNLEVVAYKKAAAAKGGAPADSTLTDEVTLTGVKRTGNTLTGKVHLRNRDGEGRYAYTVYLKARPLNGLQLPRWIKDFSTEAPVPGTPSAHRTYNLEKFAATLLVANASVAPTYLAKFNLNIRK